MQCAECDTWNFAWEDEAEIIHGWRSRSCSNCHALDPKPEVHDLLVDYTCEFCATKYTSKDISKALKISPDYYLSCKNLRKISGKKTKKNKNCLNADDWKTEIKIPKNQKPIIHTGGQTWAERNAEINRGTLKFVFGVVLAIVLLFSWLGSNETEPETFGQCFKSKVGALGETRAAAYCTRNAK